MCRRIPATLIVFLVTRGIAGACGCTEPSVQAKKDASEVIFQGTILELRNAGGVIPADPLQTLMNKGNRVAVFRVSRVWKGEVGKTFEMPALEETSMCIGFWPPYLKVGSDLLVYASRRASPYYTTNICGFHKLAKDAAKDIAELGPGREPAAGGRERK